MDRYIVKPYVEVNGIDYSRKWGIYEYLPQSGDVTCNNPHNGLIVLCNCESVAHRVANLLNIDEVWKDEL